MTERFEMVDKFKIVDAFEPNKILAVVLDPEFGKRMLSLLNSESEQAGIRSELRVARIRLTKLQAKFDKFKELLKMDDSVTEEDDAQTAEAPKEPRKRKKAVYKDKQCPGFGSTAPHMFTPTCGKQDMCPECRAAKNAEMATRPAKKMIVTTRSSVGQDRHLTIEEVLDLPVAEQEVYWTKRWSPAEVQQAKILKNKRDVEKMRAMRNKGFSLNDPIMGVNAPMPGKK